MDYSSGQKLARNRLLVRKRDTDDDRRLGVRDSMIETTSAPSPASLEYLVVSVEQNTLGTLEIPTHIR